MMTSYTQTNTTSIPDERGYFSEFGGKFVPETLIPVLGELIPHDQAEYDRLVNVLDQLIDEVGEDENHPLASLMEVIGVLIEKYEDEHVPELEDS